MNAKAKKCPLTKEQVTRARIVRAELGKVRCWLTGFHAGRDGGRNNAAIFASIPGEDSLRQAQLLLDDLLKRAD